MRRKMKLIRRILEYVERHSENGSIPVPEFDDYSEKQVHFHIGLAVEAGFIVTAPPHQYEGKDYYYEIFRMKWEGYEALERLRKEGCGQ